MAFFVAHMDVRALVAVARQHNTATGTGWRIGSLKELFGIGPTIIRRATTLLEEAIAVLFTFTRKH